MKIYICRTGEKSDNSNFDTSVLSNIRNGIAPVWGLNSSTCSGSKVFSKCVFDSIMHDYKTDQVFFMFLSPKKYSNKIVGVGVVDKIEEREFGELINISKTNEEIGWSKQGKWNYEITFRDYYDVSSMGDDFLGMSKLKTLNDNKIIPQSSVPYISPKVKVYLEQCVSMLIKFRGMTVHSNFADLEMPRLCKQV
jgi:hypothetical protein